MKRLFSSLAALVAATAVASAADVPGRMAPVPLVQTVPAFTWTGFYAGVHGAWISDNGEADRSGVLGVSPDALPTRLGLSDSGLGGGAQIGYLWQFGSVVAGPEADLTAMDVGRWRRFDGVDEPFALRTELSSQISWFGTVKGRIGLTMPSLLPVVQGSLVYITGGLAYAQVEHQGQVTVTPLGIGPQVHSEKWSTGFVIGAGT